MYRVTPTVQDLEVNINKLIADIKTININKASGPDGISSRGLAIAGSSALEGIVTVFKNSMTQSSFPNTWKTAKVNAIFKKGSPADVSNYRPISLLSIPSKLLESQICSIIDTHLNSCGTKSCKQWGFSKGLSTEGMLISMTERWKTAIGHVRYVSPLREGTTPSRGRVVAGWKFGASLESASSFPFWSLFDILFRKWY